MDVEDYILKPSDEEELIKALKDCISRLEELESQRSEQIDEKVEFLQFLEGNMEEGERSRYLEENGIRLAAPLPARPLPGWTWPRWGNTRSPK